MSVLPPGSRGGKPDLKREHDMTTNLERSELWTAIERSSRGFCSNSGKRKRGETSAVKMGRESKAELTRLSHWLDVGNKERDKQGKIWTAG